MAQVNDVARAALNAVNSNAGLMQAIAWTSQRYRQLSNRGKMRHLRRVGEVVIPAVITAGTVTTTRDSEIVTADATALAAWAAAPLTGRYIRFSRNWYKISGTSPTGLVLESPAAETAVSAGDYKIVQKHTQMPPDMRQLGRFVNMRLYRPLTVMSMSELEMVHPERQFVTTGGPEIVTEIGNDDEGRRVVEFYPYSSVSELVRFMYWAKSPDLHVGDSIPDDVDVEVLKSGVLIDVYRFEMAKALRDNKVEVAAVWRNELRAQETTWESRMQEAMQTDRASDDISVILHTGGGAGGGIGWVHTARGDALSRLTDWP